MNFRLSILAYTAVFVIGPAVRAEIIVSPPSPLSTERVTITLTHQYTSEASIESESIALDGDTFTISQTVVLACPLPNAPILTSEFNVGRLNAGTYQIIAEVELVSPLPDCGGTTRIETSEFDVTTGSGVAVPTLSTAGLALTAGLLLLFGLRRIRAAGNPPPA